MQSYEKEVRSRVGPNIAPELDTAFNVLRGAPSKKKFDMSTVDLSKGASKKKPPSKRNNASGKQDKKEASKKGGKQPQEAESITAAAAKATKKLPSTPSNKHTGTKHAQKNNGIKKAAKTNTKERQSNQVQGRKVGSKVQSNARQTKQNKQGKAGSKANLKHPKVAVPGPRFIPKARCKLKNSSKPRKPIVTRTPRETVQGSKFILNGLQWSVWKLAVCKSAPDHRNIWQERRNGRPGVRSIDLFDGSTEKAAIYEFAVRHNSQKKYVVYAKAVSGFKGRSWESALLGKDRVQEEIDSIINKGCELYVRRAVIKNVVKIDFNRLETPQEFSACLRSRYDYAWRFMFRIGSQYVSHRQIDIGGGIIVSNAAIQKCQCEKCRP